MNPPSFLEAIFGLLDHLKWHSYGGAIHPCIDCWGTTKSRRGVFPKQQGSELKYPVLLNLDHIWQTQQTLGNVRWNILALRKTRQMRGLLVQNVKAIAQKICVGPSKCRQNALRYPDIYRDLMKITVRKYSICVRNVFKHQMTLCQKYFFTKYVWVSFVKYAYMLVTSFLGKFSYLISYENLARLIS